MTAGSIVGKVLLFLALPLVFLGLIDPLEGGISLLAAAVLYAIAFVLLKTAPPKYLWVPFIVSVVVGVLTLAYAISRLEFTPGPTNLEIPVIVGIWVYRVSVLATLVGAVLVAINSVRHKAR